MDRKEFLKRACGLCAGGCAAGWLGGVAPLAAEEKPVVDQRLAFARYQVAKMVGLMAEGDRAPAGKAILRGAGRECARLTRLHERFKGDPEGYFAAIRETWGTEATWDKEKGLMTITGGEGECSCPLVDPRRTPAFFCNCAAGFQQEAFETIFGKPVEVTLRTSKLSGSPKCVFEVRLSKEQAPA